MRKPLVAGNWKMHGSRADSAALVRSLLDRLPAHGAAEVMVCPPFVYLRERGGLVTDRNVARGAETLIFIM